MKKKVHDPGGPGSQAARKNKNSAESKKRKIRRTERERPYVEGGKKDDCTTRRW